MKATAGMLFVTSLCTVILIILMTFLNSIYFYHTAQLITKENMLLIDAIVKLKKEIQSIKPVEVTVTAYSPEVSQTDQSPHTTAFATKVKPWTVAVSRDLFNQGWVAGKKVYIEGIGVFVINDLMHHKKSNQVDIFFWTRAQAIQFGVKQSRAILLNI